MTPNTIDKYIADTSNTVKEEIVLAGRTEIATIAEASSVQIDVINTLVSTVEAGVDAIKDLPATVVKDFTDIATQAAASLDAATEQQVAILAKAGDVSVEILNEIIRDAELTAITNIEIDALFTGTTTP